MTALALRDLSDARLEALDQHLTQLRRLREPPGDLHPKQRVAFESEATEILYGGAAGGGKSHLFRRAAIAWCRWIPGLQVYIFRREFPDLYKNHMEGPTGFPVMLGELIDRGEARIVWHKNQIRFRNGSVIHLCHCQYEKDVYGYQGAEIHVLLIDELTQWTQSMYSYLRSRVRLGALKIPRWLAKRFPRIMSGANPGGIGHNWVKNEFVDVAPPLQLTQMPDEQGGMVRQFIPALLADNPTMEENDPKYRGRLRGIFNAALADAMETGNWDIVAGGMFDDVWKRDVHVIKPFAVPHSWTVTRAFDWGSSKPFSVGWWATSDGTEATMSNGVRRTFPRGTKFRMAEWYGWNGKANEGCKMLAVDIAKEIKRREGLWGLRVNPGPADSSIFDTENGNCIADDMKTAGVEWTRADKSPGSRKNGWERMRMMFNNAIPQLDTNKKPLPLEGPGLFVFDWCTHFIRTVPVLPRDAVKSDDVDTKAEDHIADETRYELLAPQVASVSFSSGFR